MGRRTMWSVLLLVGQSSGLSCRPQCSRRGLLLGGAAAVCSSRAAKAAVDTGDELRITAGLFDRSLADWDAEIGLMQLSRSGRLQQAAERLPDSSLKQIVLGEEGAKAAKEYKKHKDSMLTYLFLASGATKYESAETAFRYMALAKQEAQLARAALQELAAAGGVQLELPSPTS